MLTSKQEAFAQAVAANLSLSDAYRKAYNTTTTKATSVHPTASKLARDPNVALRIEELKQESAIESSWTRERYVLELWRRSQAAANKGQYASSIKALELIARACGIGGSDRVEHTGTVGVELLARLSMADLERLVASPVALSPPDTIEGQAVIE